jgi:hypothetical protein
MGNRGSTKYNIDVSIRRKTGLELAKDEVNGESPPIDSDSLIGLINDLEDTASMVSPMSTDRSEKLDSR